MVKNNNLKKKKTFFINKISKTLYFFSQKSIKKKKCHIFLGAFIWNHPKGSFIPRGYGSKKEAIAGTT